MTKNCGWVNHKRIIALEPDIYIRDKVKVLLDLSIYPTKKH